MTTTRRLAPLAAALISSAVSSALFGATPSLEAAAQALRDGDAVRAATLYEGLAQRGESLEAELGLVRASLQAGEFRKAMSFANLTAGEHPDSAEAQALLAFLNDRTGRTEQALATLKTLETARPNEWSPVAIHAEILTDRYAPDQAHALLQSWSARHPTAPPIDRVRVASWLATSFQTLPVDNHRIVGAGNGVVIDGGKTVLTYAQVVPAKATEVLVRNGVGRVTRARVDRSGASGDLIRLRLTEPFPASASVPLDQVSAPEGVRFCFAFAFSTPRNPAAAYPAIAPGLVVRPDAGVGGLMQITSALGPDQNGAPIFDARGKLIGLALGTGDHQIAGKDLRRNLGKGAFALRLDETLTGGPRKVATKLTPPGKQAPMPAVEELFERLAPAVVQIVAIE
jgi:hypothetical protein